MTFWALAVEWRLEVRFTTKLDPFDPQTWSEQESRYFGEVDAALAAGSDLLISNGKPEHAVYLVEKFLAHAKKSVRLFSGRLSRAVGGVEVYGSPEVGEAADKLLTNLGALQIVLEHDIDVDEGAAWAAHPLVRIKDRLEKEGRLTGHLEIRQASEESLAHLRRFNFLNHWMVMDDSAYRLETDARKATAHVNFGDAEMAGMLAHIFDRLFKDATPLPSPP